MKNLLYFKKYYLFSFFASLLLWVAPQMVFAQYCEQNLHQNCNNTGINSVRIGSINTSGTWCSSTNYPYVGFHYYQPTFGQTTTLQKTVSYNITVGTNGSSSVAAWVDWNRNLEFDPDEFVLLSTSGTSATGSIVIPNSASLGTTRLRIRAASISNPTSTFTPADGCKAVGSGNTVDFIVTIASAPPCTANPPSAGTITGPTAPLCPGATTRLDLTGQSAGATLQWQFSANNTSWTDIAGETNPFYTTSSIMTSTTFFRVKATCGSTTATSPSFQVQVGPIPVISTFPHTIDFSNTVAPTLPCGWSVENPGNNEAWIIKNQGTSAAPDNAAYYDHKGGTPDDWLFTPMLALQAGKSYQVSFKYKTNSTTGVLEVRYGAGANAAAMPAVNSIYKISALTNRNYGTVTTGIISPATTGNFALGFYYTHTSYGTYVYIDDIEIIELPSCAGTPTAGSTMQPEIRFCAGQQAEVTLSGVSTGSGLTHVWEESDDNGVADPWGPAVGGNALVSSAAFTYQAPATLTQPRYYRLKVTCTASGQTATSAGVKVVLNPANLCYCNINLHSNVCGADYITRVSIPGTSLNQSTASCNSSYTAFWPGLSTATATVLQGSAYTLEVETSQFYNNGRISVWADWNRNGVFEASEHTQLTMDNASQSGKATITVPATAALGETGMRMRYRQTSNFTANDACATFGVGTTQDFIVTIGASLTCTSAPNPGSINGLLQICSGKPAVLSLSGHDNGTSLQWQSSTDSITWTNISNATQATYSIASFNTPTYYRVRVTCPGGTFNSLTAPVRLTVSPPKNCPCDVNLHSNMCDPNNPNASIDSVQIIGTTLSNLGSGCSNTLGNSYSRYPATGNTTATLVQGTTYTIRVALPRPGIISAWLDYNQNGVFEATEWTQVSTSAPSNTWATATITVPASAPTGTILMRIRSRSTGSPNGATDGCTNFLSGETEDYPVTISAPLNCTSAPAPGSISGDLSACSGKNATLTVSGYDLGTFLQWQFSSDSLTWNDVSGAVQPLYTTQVLAATYYRVKVSCANSSFVSYTTPVKVTLKPGTDCPCDVNLHSSFCNEINDVVIQNTSLSNLNTGCASTHGQGYSRYAASGNTTATLSQGSTYSISVTTLTGSIISVWFDYNRNGIFEASEWTQVTTGSSASVPAVASFTVPTTAATGYMLMRIRSRTGLSNGANDACTTFGSGETEDYTVTIAPAGVSCANPPVAGIISGDTTLCYADSTVLTLAGQSAGAAIQWQSSVNGTAWANIAGATAATYNTGSLTASQFYRAKIICVDSAFSQPIHINVGANTTAATLPFIENFDGVTAPAVP
ncbi:MAG: GEVED domain-containing protein, partial [Hymenobacteraceae bacterium]|nr:GEVED domain-containing protein [Hymenobacteraceae bacterium]